MAVVSINRRLRRWGGGVLGGLGLMAAMAGCQLAPSALGPSPATEPEDCVAEYDPQTDYFPNKATVDYATGFAVDYHNHYKVVTVRLPWQQNQPPLTYVLVQCGTPVPDVLGATTVITIPVERVVALSTTHLPYLDALGQVETLVGVGQFAFVHNANVRRRIDQGELLEMASGQSLNLEQLLVAEPDLVMAIATGNTETDSPQRLQQAGLPVVAVAEFQETSPLGRAEWLKFTALFFNQETQAEERFSEIATEYNDLRALTANLTERPTVFSGASYEGTWYVPGGKSYAAQLFRDAGADYLWASLDQVNSLPLDVEAVYDRAATAEFWLNGGLDWQTLADAIAADPRHGQFRAFQQGQVFNNNARLNAAGGNDYWESGSLHPHWILADLIHIFHPDLLPDHQFIYYQPLTP